MRDGLDRVALQARAIGLSQELRDNLLKAVDATEDWRREAAEFRCTEVFALLSKSMKELERLALERT